MGDANDFTFCQVGSKVDDYLESPETIPNIGAISLEESHLNGPGTSKSNNSLQNDNSVDNAISEESVANDSLPSKTIKTLPHKFKLDESVKPGVSGGIGESVNGSQELKPATKIVRTKVPFEKGYSQMDWLKITRTHPDLAGLKGQSNRRLISMDEIRQHKTGDSIWTVLKGRVYNISPYMKFHPGGVDMLMKASGKDCTALFNKYHAWVNAEFLLEKCLVGFLDDSQ